MSYALLIKGTGKIVAEDLGSWKAEKIMEQAQQPGQIHILFRQEKTCRNLLCQRRNPVSMFNFQSDFHILFIEGCGIVLIRFQSSVSINSHVPIIERISLFFTVNIGRIYLFQGEKETC